MSRKQWRFAPTEIKRAISVVQQAGLAVRGIEIAGDGTIRIHTTDSAVAAVAQGNPWDEVLTDAAHQKRAS
jgi:hypothetical protein